jgi:hypothetical protein
MDVEGLIFFQVLEYKYPGEGGAVRTQVECFLSSLDKLLM